MTPKPGECCLETGQLDQLARGEQVRATVGRDDGRGQVDSVHGLMSMARESKFEQVKRRLADEWGLTLSRNDPASRGWWNGCWRTGYAVSGPFPGSGHSWRRYGSLKQIVEMMDRGL